MFFKFLPPNKQSPTWFMGCTPMMEMICSPYDWVAQRDGRWIVVFTTWLTIPTSLTIRSQMVLSSGLTFKKSKKKRIIISFSSAHSSSFSPKNFPTWPKPWPHLWDPSLPTWRVRSSRCPGSPGTSLRCFHRLRWMLPVMPPGIPHLGKKNKGLWFIYILIYADICSYMVRYVQICPDMFRYVQI